MIAWSWDQESAIWICKNEDRPIGYLYPPKAGGRRGEVVYVSSRGACGIACETPQDGARWLAKQAHRRGELSVPPPEIGPVVLEHGLRWLSERIMVLGTD